MKNLILAVVITFLLSASNVQAQDFCKGDFNYDGAVGADDVTEFLNHFGRNAFTNPCPPDGPTPVPKTGQTTSYSTGDDGDHQRGVALVIPRFTDNGDGTVTDNQTGLIWLKDAHCAITTRHDPAASVNSSMTWQDALDFVAGINDGTFPLCSAGHTDWRLPNRFELESLLVLEYYYPSLPNTAGTGQWTEGDPFINVQWADEYYWSSTTSVIVGSYSWSVHMANGFVYDGAKSSLNYVWPVRGGQ